MIDRNADGRAQARDRLLVAAGWAGVPIAPLAADASSRSYARLTRDGHSVLLMDAPPTAESAICPPEADEAVREMLGYNATARLAGGRLEAFIGVSDWLRRAGVRAPMVLAHDANHGFAIVEDFGDRHLKDYPDANEATLYRGALDVLAKVRAMPVESGWLGDWPLLTYDRAAMQAEADFLTGWYAPHYGVGLNGDALEGWYDAWGSVLGQLSTPKTLVLRDFHAENILVPDDGPMAVIDFQDALIGHAAYDVVSLLEDARRDVDTGLARELMVENASSTDNSVNFISDYRILALQRNVKILGVFARLVHRDGKEKYTTFFPRVRAHVMRDLDHDVVYPVRAWAEKFMPQLLSDGVRNVD